MRFVLTTLSVKAVKQQLHSHSRRYSRINSLNKRLHHSHHLNRHKVMIAVEVPTICLFRD